MKKQILISLIIISTGLTMNAQWNGTNPVWTTSNIGIGTTSPDKSLTFKADSYLGWEYTTTGSGSYHTITGGGINPMSFTVSPFSDPNGAVFKFNGNSGTKVTILNGGNVGIGTTIPNEKLEVDGYAKAGYVSIGGILSTETPKNYINLASDNHGTLLLSSNLYLSGTNLYTANTHPTMSGAAIKIPGNLQTGQSNIEFWTTPRASVIAGDAYPQTSPRMIINPLGDIGIGTISPTYKLDVCGTIRAKEIKVDLLGTCVPDFVFKKDYKLMNLNELEQFVTTKQHLPEIASEKEMIENGLNMKEFQMKLLQKMEEMTLYIIEQNKKNEKQEQKIKILEAEIKKIKSTKR